jgi:hypothetical protein
LDLGHGLTLDLHPRCGERDIGIVDLDRVVTKIEEDANFSALSVT